MFWTGFLNFFSYILDWQWSHPRHTQNQSCWSAAVTAKCKCTGTTWRQPHKTFLVQESVCACLHTELHHELNGSVCLYLALPFGIVFLGKCSMHIS